MADTPEGTQAAAVAEASAPVEPQETQSHEDEAANAEQAAAAATEASELVQEALDKDSEDVLEDLAAQADIPPAGEPASSVPEAAPTLSPAVEQMLQKFDGIDLTGSNNDDLIDAILRLTRNGETGGLSDEDVSVLYNKLLDLQEAQKNAALPDNQVAIDEDSQEDEQSNGSEAAKTSVDDDNDVDGLTTDSTVDDGGDVDEQADDVGGADLNIDKGNRDFDAEAAELARQLAEGEIDNEAYMQQLTQLNNEADAQGADTDQGGKDDQVDNKPNVAPQPAAHSPNFLRSGAIWAQRRVSGLFRSKPAEPPAEPAPRRFTAAEINAAGGINTITEAHAKGSRDLRGYQEDAGYQVDTDGNLIKPDNPANTSEQAVASQKFIDTEAAEVNRIREGQEQAAETAKAQKEREEAAKKETERVNDTLKKLGFHEPQIADPLRREALLLVEGAHRDALAKRDEENKQRVEAGQRPSGEKIMPPTREDVERARQGLLEEQYVAYDEATDGGKDTQLAKMYKKPEGYDEHKQKLKDDERKIAAAKRQETSDASAAAKLEALQKAEDAKWDKFVEERADRFDNGKIDLSKIPDETTRKAIEAAIQRRIDAQVAESTQTEGSDTPTGENGSESPISELPFDQRQKAREVVEADLIAREQDMDPADFQYANVELYKAYAGGTEQQILLANQLALGEMTRGEHEAAMARLAAEAPVVTPGVDSDAAQTGAAATGEHADTTEGEAAVAKAEEILKDAKDKKDGDGESEAGKDEKDKKDKGSDEEEAKKRDEELEKKYKGVSDKDLLKAHESAKEDEKAEMVMEMARRFKGKTKEDLEKKMSKKSMAGMIALIIAAGLMQGLTEGVTKQ